MKFNISKLGTEHTSGWMKLRHEGARDFPLGFLISKEEAEKLTLERASEILGYGGMHGVFHREKMIGFCGLRREFFERTQHRAEIGPFFVTPKYHGSGAATALIYEVIKEAVKLKIEQLELFVDTENFQAIRFYERYGFEIIATHPDGVRIDGVSRDDHFYRLKLIR